MQNQPIVGMQNILDSLLPVYGTHSKCWVFELLAYGWKSAISAALQPTVAENHMPFEISIGWADIGDVLEEEIASI